MATKQDKSKSGSDQNQPTDNPTARTARAHDTADSAYHALPDVVAEAIDAERTKLLQAHAVLKCLQQVLEYAEDDDAKYCADSAEMMARVIDDAVARLDPTRLRRLANAAQSNYEVREPLPSYCGSADGYSSAPLRLADPVAEYRAA
jgi:hypothetical protein